MSSPSQRITLTSKRDIARSLAELIIISGTSPDRLPTDVRVAGCTRTFQEIGEAVGYNTKSGVEIQQIELEEYLRELKEKYSSGEWKHPRAHIRFVSCE